MGVYTIVDGLLLCKKQHRRRVGLSAVNIAYPIVAVIQAVGAGIGMGGAIYYSICKAKKNENGAREFTAGAMWSLIISSVLLTVSVFFLNGFILSLLGAERKALDLGEEYIAVIALGAALQVIGTGLTPFIRNHGGSLYAAISMISGFVTNIILDYLFVWVLDQGVSVAAWATVIGQVVTMLFALFYLLRKN